MLAQAARRAPGAWAGTRWSGTRTADPWPNSRTARRCRCAERLSPRLNLPRAGDRGANRPEGQRLRDDDSHRLAVDHQGADYRQGPLRGRGVNARTLDYYDAIFMLPSGFGTMTEQQKKELLAFVHDEGKGLIVGHATGVAFTDWPEFAEMVGGYMDSEFNANAKIIVEDPAFPGAMAFGGATFMFNDQHPVLKEPYSRDKVHVILRLDPESLDEKNRARRPDGDFPVVWASSTKGRVSMSDGATRTPPGITPSSRP